MIWGFWLSIKVTEINPDFIRPGVIYLILWGVFWPVSFYLEAWLLTDTSLSIVVV